MKFVVLFLLGISQYALSTDRDALSGGTDVRSPTFGDADVTCLDGSVSGRRYGEQCFCICKDAKTDPECIDFDTVKTTVAAITSGRTVTDDARQKLETVREACLDDNPSIKDTICPEGNLRVRSNATDCSDDSPLYCDMTDRCDAFGEKYFCRLDITDKRKYCRRVTLACSTDDNGNILGTYTDSDTKEIDDGM